ncbi:MAG TPA: pyridoxal-dependent decarboxylase [Steroidobacteraceae bacterium]|nr:pyridoxal-dependent decarboxylase [Steroidobacteraceae bacterium]
MADPHVPESLDPVDWNELRSLAHRAVDDGLDYLRTVRDRPVWQPTPPEVLERLHGPAPREPVGAPAAYRDFQELVLPYTMGNAHPRFWAWFMGNGTPFAAVADFLAAIVNPNMGGGNHACNQVEAQVVDWCREIVGFPRESSGLLVSGGSMANFVGLTVARNSLPGLDIRGAGLRGVPQQLLSYASAEVHSCVQKAIEALGLGAQSLRKVPVRPDYSIDSAALECMIAEDRAAGHRPFCVIGNAATINTGAVDDLDALATICAREGLWFHVDGAIGALLALAPGARHLVRGMERADSVTLDLHKWLHMPFEAACAIVRNRTAHREAFALTPEYLEHTERGIAAGHLWFSDYGLQLSRGFKALKVWLSIKEHGLDRFGRLIDRNIAQARELQGLLGARRGFALMAPVLTNIVCFRYEPHGMAEAELNAFNEELLVRLHESGVAAPSYTTLQGRYCLRAAIVNHRTVSEDLGMMVDELERLALAMLAERKG